MYKEKTFAQIVREKYGDTVEQFAFRIGATPVSVKNWENGQEPTCIARSLMNLAYQHDLPIKSEVSDEIAALPISELVEKLRHNFGDTKKKFAQRIGVNYDAMMRWRNRNEKSGCGLRLLYEVAAHPEYFVETPNAFKK